MSNYPKLMSCLFLLCFTGIFGGGIQYLFFKNIHNSIADALMTFPVLWVVYFFIALALAERFFRMIVGKQKAKTPT